MRKRKRVTLPRLTVLSLDRRELAAFLSAMEALRHQVLDFRELVCELREALPKKRTRKKETPLPPELERALSDLG